MQNKKLNSRYWSKNGKFIVSKMRTRAVVNIFFSWCYQKMSNRELFTLFRVRIQEQGSELQKKWNTLLYINLFCVFPLRKADIKVEPNLGYFQSLMKNIFLRILRRGFSFRGDIHHHNIKMLSNSECQETWLNSNIAKNGKSITWYKATETVALSSIFGNR